MTKLTLSMDEEVVATAKRLAEQHQTSVSAMFTNMVKVMATRETRPERGVPAGSTVARLTGILPIPTERSDRELIAETIAERHGLAER